jgi:hypothetical protein
MEEHIRNKSMPYERGQKGVYPVLQNGHAELVDSKQHIQHAIFSASRRVAVEQMLCIVHFMLIPTRP